MNRNNYRIYHNPVNDRLVFMPHGMDQMFGTFRSDPHLPIVPPMQGMVASSLLHTPEGRKLYRQRFTQLYTNIFHIGALTNRLQHLSAKIGAAVEPDPRRRAAYFSQEVQQLQDRIVERAQFLDNEIQAPSRALKFDALGHAPLNAWKSRLEYGRPQADENTTDSPLPWLHLDAGAESSVGVWSTSVVLDAGSYRFSGRIRCRGVVPEPGDHKGGVTLRTHNRRAVQKLTGTADWTEISFDFDVDEDGKQLELRCELRAIQGEAWFDRDSLKLTKK
jgi:hypothetical protein